MKVEVETVLDQVNENAELARDVVTSKGQRLLRAGGRLTTTAIQQLARCDVGSVWIKVEIKESNEQRAERRAQIEQRLHGRFRKVAAEPLMSELMQLLVEYRLEQT